MMQNCLYCLYNFIFTPHGLLVESQYEKEPDLKKNATMYNFFPLNWTTSLKTHLNNSLSSFPIKERNY